MTYEKKKESLLTLVFFLSWGAVIYLLLRFCFVASLPFLLGAFVATLLKPGVKFLAAHSPLKRKGASFVTVLLFYTCLLGFAMLFTGKSITRVAEFFQGLPTLFYQQVFPSLQHLTLRLQELIATHFPFLENLDTQQVYTYLQSFAVNISNWGISLVTNLVFGIPKLIIGVFFTILSTFLISSDYIHITRFFKRHLAKKNFRRVLQVQQSVMRAVGGLLKTYLKLMCITFVFLWIGFFVIFHKNFMALAALIALVDFLPMIGTGVVLIPWMLLESMEGNIQLSLCLLVLFFVIGFTKNILEPKIIGKQAEVSPLVSLLSIYFGARVFGLFGALVTPLMMIIIKEVYTAQEKS